MKHGLTISDLSADQKGFFLACFSSMKSFMKLKESACRGQMELRYFFRGKMSGVSKGGFL